MHWYEELDRQLRELLPDLEMESEVPMSRYTTFRVGGPARRMAFPVSQEQLVLLLHIARQCNARPVVIGKGSNLLAPDSGVERLVIQTAQNLTGLSLDGTTLHAESGVTLAHAADFAQKNALTGLEFAHGIPGTVGGGVCMNAGAYGGELRQRIVSAVILSPEDGVRTLSNEELEFGYRHSILSEHPDWTVLETAFQLESGDPAEIRRTMETLMARRKASQPLNVPSAGSTFKRPTGAFAGTLIDQCGLKGLRLGGASVSSKHAGFIVNDGGAACTDILELIRQVQERVYAETGIQLEPEVRVLKP